MADAIITFTTTDDVVQRSTPFVCNFTITKPNPTTSSSLTQVMTDLGALDTGENYKLDFNKLDWVSISNVLGQDDADGINQDIVTTGVYTVGYKYKIEIVETGVTLLDYGNTNLYTDTSSDFTLTIAEFSTWNPYTIKITVQQTDGTIVTQTKEIHVYDTQPILQTFSVTNNILNITLQDNESDGIKFRINLNGTQIYPSSGYTDILPSPINYSMTLPRQNIIVGQANTIVIDGTDSYGYSFTSTNTFIGEYVGLMFSDINGNYYTTDVGVLLQYLNLGKIRAGSESAPIEVVLHNMTGYAVTNTTLTLVKTSLPVGTDVLFSKNNSTFTNDTILIWSDLLNAGSTLNFYVKMTSQQLAYGSGNFEIDVVATPSS